MGKSINIKCFSFQGIINNVPEGMVKFLLPVLSEYDKEIKKNVFYYVGRVVGYEGDINCRGIGKSYALLNRILSLLNRYFIKFPSYKLRLFQERLFDLFACLWVKQSSIILSSAYLYTAIKKNKALGGINIFLAGNPDDIDINILIRREQQHYGISFVDAYTYQKRIDFIKKSINCYDHIICCTISELESYRKRIPEDHISYVPAHVIPNLNRFPEIVLKKNDNLTFCYVAHSVWLKGITYLLEAWGNNPYEESRLVIAGSINKDVGSYIQQRFNELKNVAFLGQIADLNRFFRKSHVCIVPSLLDAGPTTVSEAMICGLPVIVSDGCGAKTLVKEGENGFVVPSRNSKVIAEKIDWFCRNQSAIPQMGNNAANTIRVLAKSDQNKIVAEHILKVIAQLKRENRQ